MSKKTVEVFRSGQFQSMNGKKSEFSNEDVQNIAKVYDPINAPAPVVVGHPQHDSPAFGWVSGFEVNQEGVLLAEIDQLEPSFVEAVEQGRYRKISISLFSPDSPANPSQGYYYPKHVGFLGGAAPAVSGLKPVTFAEDTQQIEVFSIEADSSAPVSFVTMNPSSLDEERRAFEREKVRWEVETQIEGLLYRGIVTPGMRDLGLVDFVCALEDSQEFSFSDSSGKVQTQNPRKWFQEFLEKMPPLIEFGEFRDNHPEFFEDENESYSEIAAPLGMRVDPEDVGTLQKIEKIARDQNISYEDAIHRFAKGNA